MNRYIQDEAICGAILGCAVGDAVGLPYEGISRRRAERLLGEPNRLRFVLGRGMVSDDTEHTCMMAQAFCEHPRDAEGFGRAFGSRLRWWLLGVPAGIGLATLRASIRLWFGFPPTKSGVYSAGNGPAMRSAVLGAAIDDIPTLQRFVLTSTQITHTDAKANEGAFAVALAAWCAKRGIDDVGGYLAQYRAAPGDGPTTEFVRLMESIEQGIAANQSVEEFARGLGCDQGVTGYIYKTVPVSLFAWLRHPRDFRVVITELVRCGGDTDTIAAIGGAIVGSGAGPVGIPAEWLSRLWEWPRSVH